MKIFKHIVLLTMVLCLTSSLVFAGGPLKEAATKVNYTHELAYECRYYLNGPQQAMPPQGKFATGTKVVVIQDSGSYQQVQSEDGTTAYVSTDCLKKL